MKTIVIGVGNPILSNDGVGIHIAKKLQHEVSDPDVVIDTAYTGGFNLVEMMKGFDKAILIDTVHETKAKTGEVRRYELSDLPRCHSGNPHDASLPEAFHLMKTLGETCLPQQVIIVGVVSNSPPVFGEHIDPLISLAVPTAVNMVLSEIRGAQVKS